MNYKYEAAVILSEHTSAMLTNGEREFKNTYEMYMYVANECAFILTNYLLKGKYTPMQYNAIRNELARLLYDTFGPHLENK